VLADARPPAFPTLVLLPQVLADARSPAFFTLVPYQLVMADARPLAFQAASRPLAFHSASRPPLVLAEIQLHGYTPVVCASQSFLLLACPAATSVCHCSLPIFAACILVFSRRLANLVSFRRLLELRVRCQASLQFVSLLGESDTLFFCFNSRQATSGSKSVKWVTFDR